MQLFRNKFHHTKQFKIAVDLLKCSQLWKYHIADNIKVEARSLFKYCKTIEWDKETREKLPLEDVKT